MDEYQKLFSSFVCLHTQVQQQQQRKSTREIGIRISLFFITFLLSFLSSLCFNHWVVLALCECCVKKIAHLILLHVTWKGAQQKKKTEMGRSFMFLISTHFYIRTDIYNHSYHDMDGGWGNKHEKTVDKQWETIKYVLSDSCWAGFCADSRFFFYRLCRLLKRNSS